MALLLLYYFLVRSINCYISIAVSDIYSSNNCQTLGRRSHGAFYLCWCSALRTAQYFTQAMHVLCCWVGPAHLCHMTIVFSCFALGCQDLYLEELESDWNPEQELCQGETECLHCYSKQRSAFRRLRPGHISVHMSMPICAVWSSQTNETHLRFHGHRCHCSPGALAAGTGRIGKDWAGF